MEKNMNEVVQDSSVDFCYKEEKREATIQRRNALADIFNGFDDKAVKRLFDMSGITENVPEEERLKMRWGTISGEERFLICVSNQRRRRNGMGDIFQDVGDTEKMLLPRSKDSQDKAEFNLNTPDLFHSCEDSKGIYDVKPDQRRSSLPVSIISRPMLCSNAIFILNSMLIKSFRINGKDISLH
ncbi:hypothetical protein CHS0354_014627 [Potamilus streckersoni]|uniref:Uncharacterized protein n=1 Tax=Potamilus streckersoni TaxID=2493646 RepID=A0AAE0SQ78_9BIVA|nr:hypothetical protein CHS0354_014627 [Potamilus streckersoni]